MEKASIETWLGERIRLIKKDLPTVAICVLSYAVVSLYGDLKVERKQNEDRKNEELRFWREAYRSQAENTFSLMKKIKQDEKSRDTTTQ